MLVKCDNIDCENHITGYCAENLTEKGITLLTAGAGLTPEYLVCKSFKEKDNDIVLWLCNYEFKGEECGYKGSDTLCTKFFDDCKIKDNLSRFPAPPADLLLGRKYKLR